MQGKRCPLPIGVISAKSLGISYMIAHYLLEDLVPKSNEPLEFLEVFLNLANLTQREQKSTLKV